MSLDITALSLMKHRDRFDKYVRSIPESVLSTATQTVLKDFGVFFAEFPDVKVIEHDQFFLWFKMVRHPKLNADTTAIYDTMLRKIHDSVMPEVEAGFMDRLVQADAAQKVQTLVEMYNDGGEVFLPSELRKILDEMDADITKKVKTSEVTTPIEEMLVEDKEDSGLHFRLDCLNRSMRPLRGGDYIVVAGRPDKGKTSFLTDNLTFMAPQLEALFPGEDRCIAWFNNEGPGKRIKYRCYQSALNATTADLVKMQADGTLHPAYAAALGGRANTIRVFDIHDWYSHEISDLLKTLKVGMIVLDMIDNIKFSGGTTNNGQRTDQLLEEMYKWGRNIAVKLDVPVIATSQISADGDGLSYPTLSMLKDSKTGKQGAAEAIITLGALNEVSMQGSRFIGMTKNKLHREGGPRDPRAEVLFDGLRGRFSMPGGI